MSMHPFETSRAEHNGTSHGAKSRAAAETLHALGQIPHKLQVKAQENPQAALLIVGAAAFVMGGLVASRIGRFALAAAIPVVVSRFLDGTLGKELSRMGDALNEKTPATS